MRYDTPVYFRLHTDGAYNERTGNYEAGTVTESEWYANVMDTQTSMLQIVYGELKQGSVTIQLQNEYVGAFDHIRIGDNVYKADYMRRLRGKQTFICSQTGIVGGTGSTGGTGTTGGTGYTGATGEAT